MEDANFFKALSKISSQRVTVLLPGASDLTEAEHCTKKEGGYLQEALQSIEKAQHSDIWFKMQCKEDMIPMHWAGNVKPNHDSCVEQCIRQLQQSMDGD
jgi:hypothetical protein